MNVVRVVEKRTQMVNDMEDKSRQILAEGKHLRLVRTNSWEYVERTNATAVVTVLAVTADDKIVLIEQFRTPVGHWVIELPAGLVGDSHKDEPIDVAARRELLEETGYSCRRMMFLAKGPPTPGLADEIISYFRADGVVKTGPGGGEEGEIIRVHEVPLISVDDWLHSRDSQDLLIDPKVYAGLYLLSR